MYTLPQEKKITRRWSISYSVNGAPNQKKYGDLNKLPTVEEREKEAERLIKSIEEEYSGSEEPVAELTANSLDKRQLIKALEEDFDERKEYLREGSVKMYQTPVTSFLLWFSGAGAIFTDFTEGTLKEYITALKTTTIQDKRLPHKKNSKRTPTAINLYASVLKSFFKDLVRKKIIAENPLANYCKLPEHRKSYSYFDEALQVVVYQSIAGHNAQLWLACQMQYYCLIRPKELRQIKVGDINLNNSSIKVVSEVAKNKKTMFVRIPDSFIEQLRFVENYPEDFYLFGKKDQPSLRPVGVRYFGHQHQKVLRELHINTKKYVFYSWKHTGAVMFYLATRDIKALKEQGRWHSLDMVEEYLKNLGVFEMESIKKNYPQIKTNLGINTSDLNMHTSVA